MRPPPDGWDPDEREALDALQPDLDALQARHPTVPPMDLLRAARHDALPAELQARAERRLSEDAWARALVEGVDAVDPALSAAEEDRLLARVRPRAVDRRHARLPYYGAFALAAAAVVAMAIWIVPSAPPPTPPAELPRASTPPAAPPAAVRVELPLEHPPIVLSLAALTWRGGGADNPLLRDLKSPLDAFQQRDYVRADREFAAMEASYPRAVEVFFYGAVARLFLGEAGRALPAFERAAALSDSTLAPRISWYRAIAEYRAGNADAARARLETLCRAGGEYGSQACKGVEQIDATKDAR